MIKFRHSGSFKHTDKFFKLAPRREYMRVLHSYGQEGIRALALATPKDSGETASAWGYTASATRTGVSLTWTNSKVTSDGIPIVILLQYGHATRNGGYVQGRNFINPAIQPIFDRLVEALWLEVKNL